LEENGLLESVTLHRMGVSDEIVTHGDPKVLLGRYGLDADGIYLKAKQSLAENSERHSQTHRLKAVK
jgi:deoxyxylulose-5-phosphate synthase